MSHQYSTTINNQKKKTPKKEKHSGVILSMQCEECQGGMAGGGVSARSHSPSWTLGADDRHQWAILRCSALRPDDNEFMLFRCASLNRCYVQTKILGNTRS